MYVINQKQSKTITFKQMRRQKNTIPKFENKIWREGNPFAAYPIIVLLAPRQPLSLDKTNPEAPAPKAIKS